jgi:hypothetical protein
MRAGACCLTSPTALSHARRGGAVCLFELFWGEAQQDCAVDVVVCKHRAVQVRAVSEFRAQALEKCQDVLHLPRSGLQRRRAGLALRPRRVDLLCTFAFPGRAPAREAQHQRPARQQQRGGGPAAGRRGRQGPAGGQHWQEQQDEAQRRCCHHATAGRSGQIKTRLRNPRPCMPTRTTTPTTTRWRT